MTSANPATLATVLKSARHTVVYLDPGKYGALSLRDVDLGVAIIGTPDCVFENGVGLGNVKGLLLQGMTVLPDQRTGFGVSVGSTKDAAGSLRRSRDVVIDGVDLHAPTTFGTSTGVYVRNADNVVVTGSDMHDLTYGVQHLDCVGVSVLDSLIHNLRGKCDGIRGASSRVSLVNNNFGPFYPVVGWHCDAMQFWTTNRLEPLTDITVVGNRWRQGDGPPVQFILLGNEASLPYERVYIAGNAGMGTLELGIGVSQAVSAVIANNFLGGFTDNVNAKLKPVTPRILVRESTSGVVRDNTIPLIDKSLSTGVDYLRNGLIPLAAPGDYSQMQAWLDERSWA